MKGAEAEYKMWKEIIMRTNQINTLEEKIVWKKQDEEKEGNECKTSR